MQLYDALLGGGRVGLALSARGGFAQYGISAKEIFAAAGKQYTPGLKLQNAMSPQEVANAVHKALADTGRANLNEKLARTTMSGAEGMIQDAMTRLENSVGGSNLQGTIRVLDTVVDDINKIATAVKDVPGLGDKVFGTGAFLLMTGAVLKGVAAWRTYAAIQKTATAVAAIERTGEAAKVPIANSEAAAVTKSTGAFNGLRGMLLKAGTATLGVNAAAASTTRILAAGVVTVGLYAVAIAGLV